MQLMSAIFKFFFESTGMLTAPCGSNANVKTASMLTMIMIAY